MLELEFHRWAIFMQIALAVFALLGVLVIIAPYGRYQRAGWGPTLSCVFGWVVMELPAVLVFTFFFFSGDHSSDLVPLIFLGMWQVHYLNRTVVFPFRMRSGGRRMPILIPLLAVTFNALNSYTNAVWVGHLGSYDAGWLLDPRFLFGAGLFFGGGLAIAIRILSLGICVHLARVATRFLKMVSIAGSPHRTTCAKSSSGLVGLSPPGLLLG